MHAARADGADLTCEKGVAVDEAEAVHLAAEPVGEGEAEVAQLVVRKAALHAALVHLPVEHDVCEPIVDRPRGRQHGGVDSVLVHLR